jgi:hypothetical protein
MRRVICIAPLACIFRGLSEMTLLAPAMPTRLF